MEPPENKEKPVNQKSKVKFKIMSLKVKDGTDYVPELVSGPSTQILLIYCLVGNDMSIIRSSCKNNVFHTD